MRIEYVHASKFGNGARVAEEFRRRMAAHDVTVEVHHVGEVEPAESRKPTFTCSARPVGWAGRSAASASF